ncbi:hypothetical protein QGX12_gp047 [Pseudomonas phage Kremar]|uniref:Uncharacterized protein n=1 Tax=Pseudomonas phage Kremar TaxID=2928831 RepID=A0AAE9KEC7_9CAUD|nr:hypothetical protein QGX12_gp047 [Pseudomonas phage Kremar]UOL48470.1 hypothetical protein [Pseudomonas phage Kremar]
MEQKNKGGRPTKAEVAARGVTKTEFETGMKILKKIYGQSLDKMIEISDDESIPAKERFRMKQVLVDMYTNLIKADVALKIQLAKGTTEEPEEQTDKPLAPVFNFAK